MLSPFEMPLEALAKKRFFYPMVDYSNNFIIDIKIKFDKVYSVMLPVYSKHFRYRSEIKTP